MKVDIAFLCETVEVDCTGGKTRAQLFGVYKSDIMDSVLEVMTEDEVLEDLSYEKICDFLESRYDIETIKERK